MPRRKPRNDDLRRAVAVEAARILSEQGIRDYQLAKKKAARRLGVSPYAGMPKNSEVEFALRESLELFGGSQHRQRLQRLREAALEAMHHLEAFSPRLVGPVLDGTADENSVIDLQVFAETPEQFALYLDQIGIPYDQTECVIRLHVNAQEPFPLFQFDAGNHAYDVAALPMKALRQPPLSPIDGKPMRRASAYALRELMAAECAAA
ncbi:MAG: hypothetical protein R3200_02920 [Xanthomonadales bacterium]|nr:hypothetical protein [Xanthomonadales bacterium]